MLKLLVLKKGSSCQYLYFAGMPELKGLCDHELSNAFAICKTALKSKETWKR